MATQFRRMRDAAPALTWFGCLMAADLVLCLLGLVADHRIITGAPAWMKPVKFALSTMIAAWSFAVCMASVNIWHGLIRVLDVVLATGLLLEIVLIDLQAARGTTSHFNTSNQVNAEIYAVMGVSIACIWFCMLLLTVVLFRQPFGGSAWGWSLRLGMILALVGAGSGALMTMPSPQQLAQQRATGRLPVVGAHTVGASDGGRGLPVMGWSVDHGDLRVAHFIGMHGLQVLPLLTWAMERRRRPEGVQRKLIFSVAGSYGALFALLLWQAFRGQSIVRPDGLTVESFGLWLVTTAVAVFVFSPKEGLS